MVYALFGTKLGEKDISEGGNPLYSTKESKMEWEYNGFPTNMFIMESSPITKGMGWE
jgi:hypothetical protein